MKTILSLALMATALCGCLTSQYPIQVDGHYTSLRDDIRFRRVIAAPPQPPLGADEGRLGNVAPFSRLPFTRKICSKYPVGVVVTRIAVDGHEKRLTTFVHRLPMLQTEECEFVEIRGCNPGDPREHCEHHIEYDLGVVKYDPWNRPLPPEFLATKKRSIELDAVPHHDHLVEIDLWDWPS